MKHTIYNRNNQKIVVLVSKPQQIKGLAFIVHGLGGTKEDPYIQALNTALNNDGYITVRWDMRNSLGESEGKIADASVNNYLYDLEDVVAWSAQQSWFKQPFVLAGHSLGAMVAILYAEQNPGSVSALIAAAPVVSGNLVLINGMKPKVLRRWLKGYKQVKKAESKSSKIKWRFTYNLLNYDTTKKADALTMPTLIIVGDKDLSTPLKHQQKLYNALSADNRRLEIIKGATHRFRGSGSLDKLEKTIYDWVDKL